MTEMEFLDQEEERFRNCLKMHETSARSLKEQIGILQKIKARLQGQSKDMNCPEDQSCER